MRWIRKLVILGLAALGAYRVYELLTARAESLRATAGPPVGDAIDTVKTTAAKVKDDVAAAQNDVADDLRAAIGQDEPAPAEPRMAIDHLDRPV